mgnify:CR=1 FL=1
MLASSTGAHLSATGPEPELTAVTATTEIATGLVLAEAAAAACRAAMRGQEWASRQKAVAVQLATAIAAATDGGTTAVDCCHGHGLEQICYHQRGVSTVFGSCRSAEERRSDYCHSCWHEDLPEPPAATASFAAVAIAATARPSASSGSERAEREA